MTNEEIKEVLNFDAYYNNEDLDIEMFDDILGMEDEYIPLDKVKKLKELLLPLEKVNGKLNLTWYSLEAALILTAWGYDEGLEYLKKILEYSCTELEANYYPHRLHLYDTIYERIDNSLNDYYIRTIDNYQLNEAFKKILPSLINIINRAREEPVSLSIYPYRMSDIPYKSSLKEPLLDTLNYLKKKENKTFLDEYNIEDIEKALGLEN